MTRYLRILIAIVATGSLCSPTNAAQPNIVFILIDDMGWPDVACFGNKFHETPVIDKLATQGMRFTDFYAASPVCSSTRASIQSGQYSARVGITDFIPGHWRPFEDLVVPPIENSLPVEIRTPGNVLGKAAYATGYFGKWHLGNDTDQGPGTRGYTTVASNLGPAFQKWRAEHYKELPDSPAPNPGPKSIDLLTDQTIWFIEQNRERPFFVTLSHHSVHIPVEAREETIEKYSKRPKPDVGVNNVNYAAMVEDLDTTIGRILDKLDELDLAKNTVVIFTSDNGGLRQIYTGAGEIVSSNFPLRDEKGTVYEGGIRVPMIVRWPGKIKPGTVCGEPTTTTDLLPTFAQIAGAALPEQPIDGLSMLPLFKNQNAKLKRDAIYFHYPHYHHSEPAGAIRSGGMKLIEFFEDGKRELYDLSNDLGESKNLVEQQPERAAQLAQQLSDWRTQVGARMPTRNPKHDPVRANEWWNQRTQKPLDIEGMRRRYQSRVNRKSSG